MANLSEVNLSENERVGAVKSLIQDKPFTLGHRIVVVGTTGSGKTTLAGELAQRLEVSHVELDALHWEPHWVEAPIEIFRERVVHAVSGEAWVTDGNYSAVRDIVWSCADTIVWLDYSLPTILYRLARRTFRRIFTREELWNGNKERIWVQFLRRLRPIADEEGNTRNSFLLPSTPTCTSFICTPRIRRAVFFLASEPECAEEEEGSLSFRVGN
jgi:shikimate kinase